MTTIRPLTSRPLMAILAMIAIVAIVATTLLFGGMTTGARDYATTDFQAGQATTASSETDDADVLVAKVGETAISLATYKEEVRHLEQMKTLAQRELDGLGTETELPTKYLEARQVVLLKWGTDTAALSDLIQRHALFAKAEELEVAATEEEVNENIALAKAAYEDGDYDTYTKGIIEATGEDTYWAVVYPPKAKLALSVNNLHGHVADEGDAVDYKDVKTLWIAYTEAVMGKAVIELPESDEHSVTLEDVQGFLADVRTVDRESLLTSSEDLVKAPAGTWIIYTMKDDRVPLKTETNVAATVCSEEDADGNVRNWICDAATENEEIASLDDVILFVIVEPGQQLPVFEK